MKFSIIKIIALCALLTSGTVAADSEKWWQDGTLHTSTSTEWNAATEQNKLATAADWLAQTLWKDAIKKPADIDRLKVKAQMLVDAVNGVFKGEDIAGLSATETAAAIVTMANDLGPDN